MLFRSNQQEYMTGMISMHRNPIISNVFYRLGIVEIFGTGIPRIMYAYENSVKQPVFNITSNAIQIILPLCDSNITLQEGENAIYELLRKYRYMSISEILLHVSFGRSKVKELLKKMEKEGIVKVEGRGKATKYHI